MIIFIFYLNNKIKQYKRKTNIFNMVFLFMLKALLYTYLYYLGNRLLTLIVIISIFNYYLHNNFPDEMGDIKEQCVSLIYPSINAIESNVATITYNAVYMFSYIQIQLKKLYIYLNIDHISKFIKHIIIPPYVKLCLFDEHGRNIDIIELAANRMTACENGVKIWCKIYTHNLKNVSMAFLYFRHTNNEIYTAWLDNKSIQLINSKCISYENEFTIQFSKVRFLSVQIEHKNDKFDVVLNDNFKTKINNYIVGNKIDRNFVTYYLNRNANVYESIGNYKVHIVDQNVNIFEIDQTQTLTFTLDGYILTKNDEEKDKKSNDEDELKKKRTPSEDEDSVNFVKINNSDIIQVQ